MAKGHGSKEHLKPQAIAALLLSPSISHAARKVGIDESTLDAWLKDPEFLVRQP